MTVPQSPCCSTCPEQEDVTISQGSIPGSAAVEIAVTEDGATRSISAQVAESGYWLVRFWLIDGATPTDQETLAPPSDPGVSQFDKVSDAEGLIEFDIEHSVPGSWHLCASVLGPVTISDEIIAGV